MIGARRGSPLVLGYGEGEMYLGSDAIALAHLTNRIAYLEEGDSVEMTRAGAVIFDEHGSQVTRSPTTASATGAMIDKGNYRHFMLKEIYEQPTVVGQTLGVHRRPQDPRGWAADPGLSRWFRRAHSGTTDSHNRNPFPPG